VLETLLDLYATSTPEIRRRGRQWYPSCRRLLKEMADEHGYSVAQAAAVCAIVSANVQLISCLSFTEAILAGRREAGCFPSHQAPLVKAVLNTRHPGRFVRGPKCTAFFSAIVGDVNALVLDRWAVRAAGVTDRRWEGKAMRREIDAAYRSAAELCGETVRSFQAITWINCREQTPKQLRNGALVVPRYFDITRKETDARST
jgi:hypothetical protein